MPEPVPVAVPKPGSVAVPEPFAVPVAAPPFTSHVVVRVAVAALSFAGSFATAATTTVRLTSFRSPMAVARKVVASAGVAPSRATFDRLALAIPSARAWAAPVGSGGLVARVHPAMVPTSTPPTTISVSPWNRLPAAPLRLRTRRDRSGCP